MHVYVSGGGIKFKKAAKVVRKMVDNLVGFYKVRCRTLKIKSTVPMSREARHSRYGH